MDLKKVLFISQEIDPYVSETPLAAYSRSIAQYLQEKGSEVRTFMPKYGAINERRNQLHEVIRLSGMNVVIDDTDHPLIIKVATLQPARLQVYFLDNDDFFLRQKPEGLETETWPEVNDERSIFFSRGTAETVKKLRWEADLVACVGWVAALTPLYVKYVFNEDPSFRKAKTVFHIYPQAEPMPLDPKMIDKLKEHGFNEEQLAALMPGSENGITAKMLNKLAIDHADALVLSAADLDPELVEYARATGKPIMEYPGDDASPETYKQFYLSL